jgi:hypothetical protein
LSLKEAIERRVNVMLNDAQTRLLSGAWGEVPFGELTADHLAQAKRNLAQCTVVGLTERFDESLLLMQRAFGWGDISYQRANVTQGRPKKESLDAATLAVIRQAHPLDLALYDYAQQLFAEQKRRYGVGWWQVQAHEARKRWSPFYEQARRYSVRHAVKQAVRRLTAPR